MVKTHDLISQLSSPTLDGAKVRVFAEHVAKFEAESGIKPKKILVNGIPPFDDIPTVEFDVPKAQLSSVIERLLGSPAVNPNIIINGIPAFDHYQIRVMGGR